MKLHGYALAFALSMASFAAAAPARAQGRTADTNYVTKGASAESPSYEVNFVDDPLDALPTSTYVARIHVAGSRVRVLLARPRTSFVKEMLTSVETL